jgi:hypothetical protein
MFSTLSLLILINSHMKNSPNFKQLIEEICDYPLIMHPIFEGWQGMDSKLSVVLVHLAFQHTHDETRTHYFQSCNQRMIKEIYAEVYAFYVNACQNIRIPFVPNINGLKTILENRKKR